MNGRQDVDLERRFWAFWFLAVLWLWAALVVEGPGWQLLSVGAAAMAMVEAALIHVLKMAVERLSDV